MRIKRFTGKDLPSVVNQIKLEFGLKAIILSERQKPEGQIEVTAGVRDEDLEPVTDPANGLDSAPDSDPGPQNEKAQADSASDNAFDQALERENEREHPRLSALSEKISPKAKPRSRPLRPVPEAGPETGPGEPPAAKVPPAKKAPSQASTGQASPSQVAPGQVAPALGAAAYRKVQTAPVVLGDLASDLSLERQIVSLREYVSEELGELKNLFWDLAHRQSLTEKWRDRPDVVGLYRFLLATGLSPKWAREFAEKSAESKDAWGGDLYEYLRKTIKPRLRCLSPDAPLPRLIALTGPSGSGKTTSLVRLAAWYQKKGRKVSAITLDTLKLGAVEQLERYARIMGLGLKACQNRKEFSEANEIFEDSDLVLVDTNTRDFTAKGAADDLGAALMEAGAKRLLVLPAGLKSEDLESLHKNMAGPTLLGLVLTKLDETETLGNVVGFLAGNGPPLCFFSVGPRTPEDFLPASPDKLLDLWLRPKA
ncbi:MAG: hypothetical protein LBF38_00690 [Deltaproteobacteria bacterium]|jgi:flagellar biosynthesis protein FlhF|nr:hypothetical protein [Deltaproteobacteria bacterium]